MKVKLGQQIQFKKAHQIQLAEGGTATVKAGDSAMVVRKIDDTLGEIVYMTGAAKGLSHKIPLEVDDTLDTDSILKKIMNELGE